MKVNKLLLPLLLMILLFSPTVVYGEKIHITLQPKSQSVVEYQPIKLKVSATGKQLDYQWYVSKNNKKSWHKLEWETAKQIEIKFPYNGIDKYFKCYIEDVNGNGIWTNEAKIHIKPIRKIKIIKNPEDQYTRNTGEVTFSAEAKGRSIIYQWYISKDNGTTWEKFRGKNTKEISFKTTYQMNRYLLKCTITNKYGISKDTKSAALYITDADMIYTWQINRNELVGLYEPKAIDGRCYVYSYDHSFIQQIKESLNIINKAVGDHVFIYTDSPHIADIVMVEYNPDGGVVSNMWYRGDEPFLISASGYKWAGVTFNGDNEYLHYLVALNRVYLQSVPKAWVRATIIHELGHCIGLGHSPSKKDIMYYICRNFDKLSDNDKESFVKQCNIIKNIGMSGLRMMDLSGAFNVKKDICYKYK